MSYSAKLLIKSEEPAREGGSLHSISAGSLWDTNPDCLVPEVFAQALEVGATYVHPDGCVVANDGARLISNCIGSLLAVGNAIRLEIDAQLDLEPRTAVKPWRVDRRQDTLERVDYGQRFTRCIGGQDLIDLMLLHDPEWGFPQPGLITCVRHSCASLKIVGIIPISRFGMHL